MPRNRSEAQTFIECPEVIRYAEACERWLNTGKAEKFDHLWGRVPWLVCDAIVANCGRLSESNERRWRKLVVIFIRSHYHARPQSSSVVYCPAATHYADECEKWLAGEDVGHLIFANIWNQIPLPALRDILQHCGRLQDRDERTWRADVMHFVRRNYSR